MKIPLILLPLTLLTGLTCAADPSEVPDDALRAYLTLHKMTETPRSVSTEFSLLCGMNPASSAAMKRTGPHYAHWINVYMNDSAQAHFEAKEKTADTFPAGSIVVKEKLYPGHGLTPGSQVAAVAGMVKHAPGYNAKGGDWEFFFYYKDGKIERGTQGKLSSCADCHRDATKDYVFGDFAKPAAAR